MGEREGENINVWLPLEHPPLGTWPATQTAALTGNQTRDPLVHSPALNSLSHTRQGPFKIFNLTYDKVTFESVGRLIQQMLLEMALGQLARHLTFINMSQCGYIFKC